VKLENKASYQIRGKIGMICSFQKILKNAETQDIIFYAPTKSLDQLKIGETYQISIDSIERLREPALHTEGDATKPWSWNEVASWIDTEGAISGRHTPEGNFLVIVSQKEKEVLVELACFLEHEGLRSQITLNKHTGVYRVAVSRVEQVAKVTAMIEPFIRTRNKKGQIERFKNYLRKPRKSLRFRIREARSILNLQDQE
jgi:hypothetical protein